MPPTSSQPTEYQQLLHKVAGLTPPAFIMGGLAEDVLLGDGLDRPHKDLDLLVPPDDLDRLLAQLHTVGVGDWEVVLAGAGGQSLLLSGRALLEDGGLAGSLEVEAYATQAEPDGGYSFEVPAQGPSGRRRLFLPPDTFDQAATVVDGLTIHTLSPLALALMRAASAQTRHTGEKRARDLAVLALLRQVFLSGCDDAQLQPRIETIDG